MIITDNTTLSVNLTAKQILVATVFGASVVVDNTMQVRLSHATIAIEESTRSIQIFGAISIGLAFYNSLDSIIAQPIFSVMNIVTPDTTLIPVDALGLYGNHPEFLAIADMQFNAGAVPIYIKPFASVKVSNTNNVAGTVVLTLNSIIERK